MCDHQPTPDEDEVTAVLDRVYDVVDGEPEPFVLAAAMQTLERTEW